MKAVYGLYTQSGIGSARRRCVCARREFRDRQITILSSEPLEEYEFGKRDRQTWMTWIAALGGLIGLTIGYLLTSITQNVWPINTGGMPIVTNWTNLIIIFELTMLGAVFRHRDHPSDHREDSRPACPNSTTRKFPTARS